MKNSKYWEHRQAQRMFEYMELSEESAKEISKYYRKASLYINGKLDQIFNRYQSKFGLSEEEARQLLNMLDDSTSIDELLIKLKSNLTTEERKELLAMIEAPSYRARLNRLQDLQKEIDVMMQEIYKQEKEISTNNYINVAKESYYKSIFDIQQRTGYGFSFSSINSDDFNRLINSKWSGANFSERIWSNTHELAKTLKEELIVSMITGRKELDVAKIIENKFNVGNSKARRIVRTESCFISGEMQAKAYEEAGIEKYRFVATLDLKTSKICRELDGKVFELSKREVGKNYHPMHPWCRSTTISIIDDEALSKLERAAIDPETGQKIKVPANMTYEEWYEKYVSSNPNAQAEEKKYKNRSSDKKQYKQYKAILGKENMPDKFEDFQEMKYNDIDKWKSLNTAYKDAKLQSSIRSGEYNLTLREGQQGKHLLGHNNYIDGKSYINASMGEIQKSIDSHAGKGSIERTNTGKWKNQEMIFDGSIIGYVIDIDGNPQKTHRFKIHYSKEKGTHMVPTLKGDY